MVRDSSLVHSSWDPVLEPHKSRIESILLNLKDEEIAPAPDQIFRALDVAVDDVKCVILGQDPYPTKGNAHGLAFSVPESVTRIPASLKNIFRELENDMNVPIPERGDLSPWLSQGVLLLNRVLTTEVGKSNAHARLGWQGITESIIEEVAKREPVAILWGNSAQEMSQYFRFKVESVHPSPLSAYRGFFGSKPFSRVNEFLRESNRTEINWSL
jgi:uracil-DNA glycosylase